MIARIALVFHFLCAGNRALPAQRSGPGPDSAARAARAYYAAHPEEYAAERRALAAAGGRAARAGGVLRLRLASGRTVALADTVEDGERHYRAVYLGFQPALGVHTVTHWGYEARSYEVFHDRSGRQVTLPAPPRASPDGRRFASASLDLGAGLDGNRLEIWRVDGAGPRCEAAIDGGEAWGPDSVAWVGPDTIRFARVTLDSGAAGRRSSPGRVVRVGTGWVIQAFPARRLTNRCR